MSAFLWVLLPLLAWVSLAQSAFTGTGWCDDPTRSTWPICNPSASVDERAGDIVSRLSLDDKISLTSNDASASGIFLPKWNWWNEATHGVWNNVGPPWPCESNPCDGPVTVFALPITTSCSFNRTMWYKTGNQIGRESRAFWNAKGDVRGGTYWTPVINIVRDPRWGRNLESAGEDPFLSGAYARDFVQGFQTASETTYPLQASACCKHFVANEYEDARTTVDTFVPQQDLVDSYLPSFQACVEEGQASGMMCSYNSVNGEPSCSNSWLLKTLLRDSWSFNGYITSDCDAEGDGAMHTRYPNPDDAVAAILKAGTDLDCGGFMASHVAHALNVSAVTIGDLDAAMVRMFKMRLRLGHFDPPGVMQTIPISTVCSPYAIELARDGVRQSVVLVKNTGGALPLNASLFSSALVVGPNYNLIDTLGYYSGPRPCNDSKWTPFDAILQHLPTSTALAGVPSVGSGDTSGVAAAAAAAAKAPLVVLTIGSDLSLEQEGRDRTSIDFSDGQKALIAAVTAAAVGPVVALVFSGGAMDVSLLLNNPKIVGVLICGQPSVAVVGAGDVLFGATLDGRPVAPAGRMSQMTYPAEFTQNTTITDFTMRPSAPGATPFNPGRTYRFYTGVPVLPFGYGLSFTSWVYTPLPDPTPPASAAAATIRTVDLTSVEAAATAHAAKGVVGSIPKALQSVAAQFWVNVTNSGTVDSDDVVLGFITPPGAGINGVPLQELFGFERVFVPKGQTVTVYLGAQGVRFTQAGEDGVRRVLRGEYTVTFGVQETAAHGMGFAQLKINAM